MTLTREDAGRIAALARLELTDDELDRLARDMRDILGHVDALRAVDLPEDDGGDVPPDVNGTGAGALRRDEPARDPLTAPLPSFAPETIEGFFALPRLASHEEEAGPDRDGG